MYGCVSHHFILCHIFLLRFWNSGRMPHYFMPQNNLLQCVTPDELKATTLYIKDQILTDPITALILAPKYPRQLYGCVEKKDECADEKDITLGLHNLFQAFTKSPPNVPTCIAFLRNIFQRLDKYRNQKYHTGQTKHGLSEPLVCLVDMLCKMRRTGPIGPDARILVHTVSRIESIQSEHQIITATTELCGNCGLSNHREESCLAEENLRCYTCHRRGHKTWLCPNDRQAHNFPECSYVRHMFATSVSMNKKWIMEWWKIEWSYMQYKIFHMHCKMIWV